MHHRYILQFSIMMLALIIITTNQVKAQQGQNSHGLTPEQVKQFCRPDNPRLSFVNSTESEICGLPKSTPSTPALNSSGSSSGTSSPLIAIILVISAIILVISAIILVISAIIRINNATSSLILKLNPIIFGYYSINCI